MSTLNNDNFEYINSFFSNVNNSKDDFKYMNDATIDIRTNNKNININLGNSIYNIPIKNKEENLNIN
jgi:hypothetical protein